MTKKGTFEFYVPKYLHQDKKINPKAIVAYSDTSGQTFFMVIREEVPDTEMENVTIELENYYTFVRSGITDGLKNARIFNDKSTIINEEEAIIAEIEGEYGGEKVYYCLAVIKTREYFYQLIGWTLKQNKETRGLDIYNSCLSFVEL
ncbi:MAG: hypothetical protein ACHQFW_04550 [Chitinophagales bacterium]